VDDLDAELHGKAREVLGSKEALNLASPCGILEGLVLDDLLRDVDQGELDEVGDEARVGAVLKHSSRSVVGAPLGHALLELLMAVIEGELADVSGRGVLVRVIDFKGGVDVKDVVLAAPVKEGDGRNLVGQVDKEIARAEILVEDGDDVLLGDLLEVELDATLKRALDLVALIKGVEDSDVGHGHVNEAGKHGEDALSEGTATNEKDATVEGDLVVAKELASLATLVRQRSLTDVLVRAEIKATGGRLGVFRRFELANRAFVIRALEAVISWRRHAQSIVSTLVFTLAREEGGDLLANKDGIRTLLARAGTMNLSQFVRQRRKGRRHDTGQFPVAY